MAGSTILKLDVGGEHVLQDSRNPRYPVLKGVFIYAHRFVVSTDYSATTALVIQFMGAQKILFAGAKEVLAASTADLSSTEGDITTGEQGKQISTALTDVNSLAVEVFAIVEV